MNQTFTHLIFAIVALTCSSLLTAQETDMYVIHSSGMVLGLDATHQASLWSNTNSAARPLHLAPQSDGSYLISTNEDGQQLYLSLGTSNGWSTYFLADNSGSRARYTIENNGRYIKLRNAYTGKYLGTDGTQEGAHVFSDKSGSDANHQWLLSDQSTITVEADTISYPIAVDARRQTTEGWGVSLCWWAGQCGKWSDAKIDKLVDWMTSPTGLNWNIFRYNIGGGDDPANQNCTAHHMDKGKGHRAEMEGFQDERNGSFLWERDEAQRKIMLKIKEKRPDAIFEAFCNSAPWWMTVSGCVSGNADGSKDNLRKDYYTDFANYLVEVCKHYKQEYDITFRTLEPFNEAMTNYWSKGGGQEGCHFSTASEVAFLRVLAPALEASGLDTQISASDETSVAQALEAMRAMTSDGIASEVAQFNTHTYGADNVARSQFGSLTRAAGKRCWMSETGAGGTGLSGNLNMLQRLFNDVRYICPEAWVDWQYMEEGNDQWCVVNGSFAGETVNKVKNYYVRQQVTRFIPAGSTFVTSLNDQSLAAINPEGDMLTIVLLNTGSAEVYHHVALPLAHIDGSIKAWRTSETESLKAFSTKTAVQDIVREQTDSTLLVLLPAVSVTTLQIPISTMTSYSDELVDGDSYLIIPQSNSLRAVSVNNSLMCLADIDADDPAQQWTVMASPDGSYRLRNGQGTYAVGTTSYDMTMSSSDSNTAELFDIEKVDGIYSRILWHQDKLRGWDLSGTKTDVGTKVGLYRYGNTVDVPHRQFMFVRINAQQQDNDTDGVIMAQDHINEQPACEDYYTLSGYKVSREQLQRGIYIYKNKKIVIK